MYESIGGTEDLVKGRDQGGLGLGLGLATSERPTWARAPTSRAEAKGVRVR